MRSHAKQLGYRCTVVLIWKQADRYGDLVRVEWKRLALCVVWAALVLEKHDVDESMEGTKSPFEGVKIASICRVHTLFAAAITWMSLRIFEREIGQ